MEQIQAIINRIQQTIATSSQQETLTIPDSYDCNICRDAEFIVVGNNASECECRRRKIYQRILEHSGISNEYQKIGFKGFVTEGMHDLVKMAKESAINYVKLFDEIRGTRRNSIAFLAGKVAGKKVGIGAGKTHLSISIANNLMARNIGVLYMPYVEAVTRIKQVVRIEEEYAREINRYKSAPVLLIDDLFKGKDGDEPTNADLRIIFDIVNHRYLAKLPLIVSSEWNQRDLINFDEATGSRIIEMAKDYLVQFSLTQEEVLKGVTLNYRLM